MIETSLQGGTSTTKHTTCSRVLVCSGMRIPLAVVFWSATVCADEPEQVARVGLVPSLPLSFKRPLSRALLTAGKSAGLKRVTS